MLVKPQWRTIWLFHKKIQIELPYDPAISFLGILPDKSILQRLACTLMFIGALLMIVKTGKQVVCPLTDQEDIVHIYTEVLLNHNKEYNNAICSNMEGPWLYQSKWRKSETETNTIWYHFYVESQIWHKWIYVHNRKRHTDPVNTPAVAERRGDLGVA